MKTKLEILHGNMDVAFTGKDGFDSLLTASIDLTGYTFDGGVYDSNWKRIADFTITPVDLPNGKVEFSLTPTQTLTLGIQTLNYDMRWIDGSGKQRTLAAGIFDIRNG